MIAARVANVAQRDLMIGAEPRKFFTEPHYNGYPAVLVRLDAVSLADLELLIHEAWRCQAPPMLVQEPAGGTRSSGARNGKAPAKRAPAKNSPAGKSSSRKGTARAPDVRRRER